MAIFTPIQRLNFPADGTNANTLSPQSFTINGNDVAAGDTVIWFDNDTETTTFNGGCEISNAIVGTVGILGESINIDNTNILMFGDTGATDIWTGTCNFNNVNFIRRQGTSRSLVGNFNGGTAATNIINHRNVGFVSDNTAAPLVHLNRNISSASVFEGIRFIGAAVPQWYTGSQSLGLVVSDVGANDDAPTAFRYAYRTLHFREGGGGAAGNAVSPDVFVSDAFSLLTEPDLSGAVVEGNAFDGPTGAQMSFQINGSSSTWLVNPVGLTRDMVVISHSGNQPTTTNQSEIVTAVAWKPVFTNAAGVVATDVVARFASNPSTIAGGTVAELTRIAPNTDLTIPSDANYKGLWIVENQYVYQTGTTAGSTSGMTALDGSTGISNTTAKTGRFWSFERVVEPTITTPTITVQDRNGNNFNIFGSRANTIDTFATDAQSAPNDIGVGSYTTAAADAPGASDTVSTLDDAYAALKWDYVSNRRTINFALTGSESAFRVNSGFSVLVDRTLNNQGPAANAVDIRSEGLTAGSIFSTIDLQGTLTIGEALMNGVTVDGGGIFGITGGGSVDNVTFTGAVDIRFSTTANTTYDFTTSNFGATNSFSLASGVTADNVTVNISTNTVGLQPGDAARNDLEGAIGAENVVTVVTPVTYVANLSQSAFFGGTEINFDGYVTVTRNSGGSRTIVQGPMLITDSNRASFAFSGLPNSTALGSDTLEITTVGDKWALGRVVIDSSSDAQVTIPVLADILADRATTIPGGVSTGTATTPSNIFTLPISGAATALGTNVGAGNRLLAGARSSEEYANFIASNGLTTDVIAYNPSGSVPATIDVARVTLSSGDGAVQSIPGLAVTGTGDLATTATVSTQTVISSAAPLGAQPGDFVNAAISGGIALETSIDEVKVNQRSVALLNPNLPNP